MTEKEIKTEHRDFADMFEPAKGEHKFLDWNKAEEICKKYPDETIYAYKIVKGEK